ncbi:uncharacterized protein BDV17DRAFT_251567 [Aspergillus undulatus]|uniref:uncharacterized protein n=1 Tax=Aspergillus undulatus TaxID=1810928 RepID=UPI003CCCE5A0
MFPVTTFLTPLWVTTSSRCVLRVKLGRYSGGLGPEARARYSSLRQPKYILLVMNGTLLPLLNPVSAFPGHFRFLCLAQGAVAESSRQHKIGGLTEKAEDILEISQTHIRRFEPGQVIFRNAV